MPPRTGGRPPWPRRRGTACSAQRRSAGPASRSARARPGRRQFPCLLQPDRALGPQLVDRPELVQRPHRHNRSRRAVAPSPGERRSASAGSRCRRPGRAPRASPPRAAPPVAAASAARASCSAVGQLPLADRDLGRARIRLAGSTPGPAGHLDACRRLRPAAAGDRRTRDPRCSARLARGSPPPSRASNVRPVSLRGPPARTARTLRSAPRRRDRKAPGRPYP